MLQQTDALVEPAHNGHSWWPNWRDQACAIVASGPSTTKQEVGLCRHRLRVLAIKENAVLTAPWADVVYGCDFPWWKYRQGLKGFPGLKIGFDHKISKLYPDVKSITIKTEGLPRRKKYIHNLLLEEPGVIGGGGNSGFQAFNLAVQFGTKRILLIGFDMQTRTGVHFYGRNTWAGGNNPDQSNFKRWMRAFDAAAEVCKKIGVDVVNASPISAMKCFRHQSVAATLKEWGYE